MLGRTVACKARARPAATQSPIGDASAPAVTHRPAFLPVDVGTQPRLAASHGQARALSEQIWPVTGKTADLGHACSMLTMRFLTLRLPADWQPLHCWSWLSL